MTRVHWLQVWIAVATASMLLAAAITLTASGVHPPSLLLAALPAAAALVSGIGITMLL